MVIAIEGTIGSGKSECMRRLQQLLPCMVMQPEPVEKWAPFLEAAYAGLGGHAALQARVMLDTCVEKPHADIVERSPVWQPLTFMPAVAAVGFIQKHEAAMLQELHARLLQWEPDHTIYLRCSVSQAVKRIAKRDRKAETNLGLGYLGTLHDFYEQAHRQHFPDAHVVDTTDKSPEDVAAAVLRHIQSILPP